MDSGKIIKEYEDFVNGYECFCSSDDYIFDMHKAVLALLKENDKQKQHWLKQIADTQLLNAPCEWQSEDQRLYAKGVWDGLQIAWDILTEGDKK